MFDVVEVLLGVHQKWLGNNMKLSEHFFRFVYNIAADTTNDGSR